MLVLLKFPRTRFDDAKQFLNCLSPNFLYIFLQPLSQRFGLRIDNLGNHAGILIYLKLDILSGYSGMANLLFLPIG